MNVNFIKKKKIKFTSQKGSNFDGHLLQFRMLLIVKVKKKKNK